MVILVLLNNDGFMVILVLLNNDASKPFQAQLPQQR